MRRVSASGLLVVASTLRTVKAKQPKLRRRRGKRPAHCLPSLWTRWTVLVCALLFGVVTTAQAAHLHRPAPHEHRLQAPAADTQGGDDEEHCPLCVAIHPALPVELQVVPAPALVIERLESPAENRVAPTVWHFARFGRPPPRLRDGCDLQPRATALLTAI